ncbi:hypothetical protein ACOMHN_024453 [Nucella lapillus]
MAQTSNTVPRRLHHWATTHPDTAAFVCLDSAMRRRVLTRADVYKLAARFAAILRRHDVRRGDVVCNTLPNSPERVVSDFGIMMAGAAAMNGQIFLADGADFLGSLQDSRCSAIILDPLQLKGAASLLASLEKEERSDGTMRVPRLPALRRIIPCNWRDQGPGVSSFLDTLEQREERYVAEVTPEDLAYIWTTSGSTGFSKLVPHCHSHFLTIAARFSTTFGMMTLVTPESHENADRGEMVTSGLKPAPSPADGRLTENTGSDAADSSHQSVFGSSKEDSEAKTEESVRSSKEDTGAKKEGSLTQYAKYIFFNNNSLGWSGGFPAAYLAAGASRVLVDLSPGTPSDPSALMWAAIRQERCNAALMLPYHLQQILSQEGLWKKLPWKLNVLTLAGQPIHASLVKEAVSKVTSTVYVFYGSSELGVLTYKVVHDPEQYQDCSNGKPQPGMEVKVMDHEKEVMEKNAMDHEKEVTNDEQKVSKPSGKMGEIIARTDTPFQGYFNNEDATKKITLPNGWFRTGDVGYFSDTGDLCVVCRSSFTIMRGAFLLHPGWLEARIGTHPGVEAVLVVPVPDPLLHQELCACVVPKPEASLTAEDLRGFCRSLFLTDSRDHMTAVPPYFLFFSALPTIATGKPCRRTTTEMARERLGL